MLRTFIASIGGPVVHLPRRSFAASTYVTPLDALDESQQMDRLQHKLHPEEKQQTQQDDQNSSTSQNVQQAQQSSYVPWYLQNQPPIALENQSTISARQRMPELPEHSPALLEPFLRQISVSLGMDDLTLLDLRAMDPPPALGANLLMVIGTARSEKHLHVSADRFCRWLRTEHKLTPFADGLLGRNELKLKMRRLAKKKKMMSAVGTSLDDDADLDDGIRTGWVCVNIGRIEGGELPKTEAQIEQESKIVGFGTSITGCNVVVQLMTEEKRGELDIEKLWTAVLRKNLKERGIYVEQEAEKEPVLSNAQTHLIDTETAKQDSDDAVMDTESRKEPTPEPETRPYIPLWQNNRPEPPQGRIRI